MTTSTLHKTHIRCSSKTKFEVYELLQQHKKIAAIKKLRNESVAWHNGVRIERPGLRESKHAVEHLLGEISHDEACATIVALPRVKSVVIDTGDGEVELDLEGLQLRLLDGLAVVPIDVMADGLRLMEILRAYDRGELDANFGVSNGKTEAE